MLSRFAEYVRPFKRTILNADRLNKAKLYSLIAVILVTFLGGCGTHVTPPEGSTASKMEGTWKWLNTEKADELSNGTEYLLLLQYGHRNKKDAPLVLMAALESREKLTVKGRSSLLPFGRVGVEQSQSKRWPLPDLAITGNEAVGEESKLIGGRRFCRVVLNADDPDVLYLSTNAHNPEEPLDKKKFTRVK